MNKKIRLCLAIMISVAAVTGGFLLGKAAVCQETLQLTLRGEREIFVKHNTDFTDPGASAVLIINGQLRELPVEQSGDVVNTAKKGDYLLKYAARYDGHITTAYRMVHIVDPQGPEIVLNGPKYYSMGVGQPYLELGCVANDNYDGDVSQQVEITGSVDTMTPGTYQLTYTVTDTHRNTSSVIRTVCVQEWGIADDSVLHFGQPNGKVIYLTFDDGPSRHTHRLLDVLKTYHVKATFFVVNTGCVDVIRRIAEDGHTLGLHTTTHKYKNIYVSEEAYLNDLHTIEGIVKELTGLESKLLRFPGGSSNKVSRFNPGIMTRLTKLVEEEGYYYYDWTVDSRDTGGAKTPEAVYQNVTSGIARSKTDHAIVLQHDIKGFSVDAVEAIILWGLENGYTFLPMDEHTPVCHHNLNN